MLIMKFLDIQLESVSKYFLDISKIVFATSVVGFFFPSATSNVSVSAFTVGVLMTLGMFGFGVMILKLKKQKV